MKLLFDANLSPQLAILFSNEYPGSSHVLHFGLERNDDLIWEFSKKNEFAIVTKDSDFIHMSVQYGNPPKVIFIKRENCPIKTIESILKVHKEMINLFLKETIETGLLIIR